MNQSFLFFELIGIFIVHLLILEPQTYVVVEQFGAENIPVLSGRLVFRTTQATGMTEKKLLHVTWYIPESFRKTIFILITLSLVQF